MIPPELESRLGSLGKQATLVGGGAFLLCVLGALFTPEPFFRAYLVAFLLVAGVALGSLALLSLHQLVGGQWGFVSRRPLEAAVRTVPWLPVFFLPLLLGVRRLYPWWAAEGESELLLHKAQYLNPTFFLARALLYFALWSFFALQLDKWSREQDKGERAWVNRLQVLGALGMLTYGLTVTFASVDWVMSLEPEWFSTIYGLLFIVGQVLSALAFLVLVLSFLASYEPMATKLSSSHFHDLGNLILAFVLLWAYHAFSQYLIIWSGNLPEEIPWYLNRTRGGWSSVGLALVVFHFTIPFFLLLSRKTKKNRKTLARLAALILLGRFVDLFWIVRPSQAMSPAVHWMDLLAPVALAGLWLALYFRELGRAPLLPLHDPRFAENPSPDSSSRAKGVLQHGTG
jgi:hypothetical protein